MTGDQSIPADVVALPDVIELPDTPAAEARPGERHLADERADPAVGEPSDPTAIASLAGRHVVVVGINYAPEHTGIAPYTTGVAEHLARYADGVSVLTGLPHHPSWTVPDSHRRRRRIIEPGPAGGPRVIRLAHYVPRRPSGVRGVLYQLTFLLHVLRAARRLTRRPDLVVAVTPAAGGAAAAARIARRLDVPLVTVVQDLTAEPRVRAGIPGGLRVTSLTARLERYALRRSTRVAVAAEAFRPTVEAHGVAPSRIDLLPNWARVPATPLARDEARTALGWSATAFIAVYTGEVGLRQDLGTLVEAVRRLADEPNLQVMIIGDGEQRAAVTEQAAGLGSVRVLSSLPEEQYPLALAAADVLLVTERAGVADTALPSRLTDYLAAGRPVLAAVRPGGATATELAATDGAGMVVPAGDPRVLAGALRELRADPGRRLQMSLAAKGYARRGLGVARSMTHLARIITAAAPVTSRSLRAFRPDGYDRGRGRIWQLAWFVTLNLVFTAWWCPTRLRPAILRAFGARVGRRVSIRHRVRVLWPWKLQIGSDCWVEEDAWLLNLEPITIEDDVCLSQAAMLCTGSHDRRDPAFGYDNAAIHVGTGAWIAARATVLRGVRVPPGEVVPAGSVYRGPARAAAPVPAAPVPAAPVPASGQISGNTPGVPHQISPLASEDGPQRATTEASNHEDRTAEVTPRTAGPRPSTGRGTAPGRARRREPGKGGRPPGPAPQ